MLAPNVNSYKRYCSRLVSGAPRPVALGRRKQFALCSLRGGSDMAHRCASEETAAGGSDPSDSLSVSLALSAIHRRGGCHRRSCRRGW